MATTNRIPSTALATGGEASASVSTSSQEVITFLVSTTQRGTAESRVRATVKDENGRLLEELYCFGTDSKQMIISELKDSVTIRVVVLSGRASVVVDELTGAESVGILGEITAADIPSGAISTAKLAAGAATLPKVSFAGIKVLQAAGINTTGGDAQVTVTGTAVGDRVVAVFGAPTAGGAMQVKVPGTDFEAVVTVVNKIVQKQAGGDISANTYVFILAPATA
jgi:uncharacterized metal-binding protein